MMSDIHTLEIDFAKNPTLDACIPLCEAYLADKRFMEAMVVCKKGIKSAPQDPRGRTTLIRVYLEQGKMPKVQTELQKVQADFPGHPTVLEVSGQVAFAQGQTQEATGFLQQALAGDPNLKFAAGLLSQMGVSAAPVQAPPVQTPAQPAPQAPQSAPVAAQTQTPPAQPHAQVPAQPVHAAAPVVAEAPAANFVDHVPEPIVNEGSSSKPMEHVGDFFAQDTLGFSNDSSAVETAGPGRLTIVGFVPKSSGSIKTTLFIVLVLGAALAAYITYSNYEADNQRLVNVKVSEIKLAFGDDRFSRYNEVVRLGGEVLAIDSGHIPVLATLAYTHAILASEHDEVDSLAASQKHLAAMTEDTSRSTAAKALNAYTQGKYKEGLAIIDGYKEDGNKQSTPTLELETFRGMLGLGASKKELGAQYQVLKTSINSEVRANNLIGWYLYGEDRYTPAEDAFARAKQSSRDHAFSILGDALAKLDRELGVKEFQKEIEEAAVKVLSFPEVSAPQKALAHFTMARLRAWQGDQNAADIDYKKAFALDGDNPMFYYRRGRAYIAQNKGDLAVADLKKATSLRAKNHYYQRALAEALALKKDYSGAMAALSAATDIRADDYEIYTTKGEIFASQKKYDEAIAAYKEVTTEMGGNGFTMAQIGWARTLAKSGKTGPAVKHLADYLSNVPGSTTAEYEAKLFGAQGEMAFLDNDEDGAMGALARCQQTNPMEASCHYWTCRVQGRAGKDACKRYLTLKPNGKYANDAARRAR